MNPFILNRRDEGDRCGRPPQGNLSWGSGLSKHERTPNSQSMQHGTEDLLGSCERRTNKVSTASGNGLEKRQ